jgi:hypothetical protein
MMSIRAVRTEMTETRSPQGSSRDDEQARVLALLGDDRARPVTIGELRERGVKTPGQAIYALQLAGHQIDRVPFQHANGRRTIGYRLHAPPAPVAGGSVRSPKVSDDAL